MATSPNYSWPEPDNTDLVKNGALAIRTMGNAIDTTMATMTPKSTYTAKGSIAAATGASTPANLSVGNNGETLVADSSTSTGLRYQNAVTVNYAINGGADIWQRGTSFSITAATPSYTADRWTQYFNGTGTVAQETTTIPTGSQYAIKLTSTSSNSGIAAYQLVEAANVYPLQGKTVTLSLQVAGTVTPNIGLAYSTTANDTLTSTSTLISGTTIANPTVSASLQTYAFSFVVPSTAKTLRIGVGTGSVINGNYIIFGNVQLEIGSIYSRFQRSGGTIQGELAACQRYYWRVGGTASSRLFPYTPATNTTNCYIMIVPKVTMRTINAYEYSNVALYDGSSTITVSSLSGDINDGNSPNINVVGVGLTQYRPYTLLTVTTGYVGISAEL